MAYSPICAEPKAYGLLDIKMSAPPYVGDSLQPLIDLGSAVDSTGISERTFWNDIHGDRNGGRAGQPVEVQYIGHMVMIRLELLAWNDAAIEILRERAVNANLGTIDQSEMGQMMLKENSIRLLIDTLDPLDRRNFWCCLARDPIENAMGTKWASYQITMAAYRPPCYHEKADILEDKDNVGGVE
jgi:hypothetical protein